ncbi:MAG: Flp family type IVb pilin [Novosphingobium sp.]
MKRILKALLKDQAGTSAVELGLICGLIVLAMLTALQGFASESVAMWDNVSSKSADAMNGPGA